MEARVVDSYLLEVPPPRRELLFELPDDPQPAAQPDSASEEEEART
jgi:hypothetical protein